MSKEERDKKLRAKGLISNDSYEARRERLHQKIKEGSKERDEKIHEMQLRLELMKNNVDYLGLA